MRGASTMLMTLSEAQANNVRLIFKASGHDYLGRSSAPNALSIWTANMKGITLHPDPFQPVNCSFTISGTSLTALAGTITVDLINATAPSNLSVISGGGRTVNIGGYHTGGGHSGLSPQYGLAADQVLEVELVTPQGDLVVANECQNEDLFWAVRGVSDVHKVILLRLLTYHQGGGSTFLYAASGYLSAR